MIDSLKDQLGRSMLHFKKAGMTLPPQFDVNMSEFVIMIGIEKSASRFDENNCISDIHNELFITKPAVSQLYSSLEKKGYISREVDIKDRRKIVVTLTHKGKDIIRTMKEHFDKTLSKIIGRLGEENTKQLIDLFNRFADISEEIKRESDLDN